MMPNIELFGFIDVVDLLDGLRQIIHRCNLTEEALIIIHQGSVVTDYHSRDQSFIRISSTAMIEAKMIATYIEKWRPEIRLELLQLSDELEG